MNGRKDVVKSIMKMVRIFVRISFFFFMGKE